MHLFSTALFTIKKAWNQPECSSIVDWIKKMWHIYTMEYYAAINKNELMSLQQQHEGHYLTKQINAETEKQIQYALTYNWELNNKNKQTQRGEQQTLGPT